MSADAKRLLIAGGGTGGHVFPAIAIAKEWIRRGIDGGESGERQVVFVGTERGIEARLVPQAGFPLELIRASGPERDWRREASAERSDGSGRPLGLRENSCIVIASMRPSESAGMPRVR